MTENTATEVAKNACDLGALCGLAAWATAAAPWIAGLLSGAWLIVRLYNEVMKAVDKKRARGGWF